MPADGGDSRRARILAPDGLVLGLKIDNGEMFERLLQEQTIPLEPGDLYIFFTDGISEAMNADNSLYGLDRLQKQIGKQQDNVTQLGRHILDDVRNFVGGRAQSDDMCLICFGRNPG